MPTHEELQDRSRLLAFHKTVFKLRAEWFAIKLSVAEFGKRIVELELDGGYKTQLEEAQERVIGDIGERSKRDAPLCSMCTVDALFEEYEKIGGFYDN